MSNVKDKLDKWAKLTNGTYKVSATINLKSDNMDLTLSGTSVEEAFSKLEDIVKNEDNEKKDPIEKSEANPLQTALFPKATETVIKDVVPAVAIPATSTDISTMLGGRNLVRIHTPSQPLGIGEEVIDVNGTQFVVK